MVLGDLNTVSEARDRKKGRLQPYDGNPHALWRVLLPWDIGLVSLRAARKQSPDRVPGPRDPQNRDLGSLLRLGT